MNLAQEGKRSFRHAFHIIKAFDNHDLPNRPGHIERTGEVAGGENTKLPPVAGLRQSGMADVIFKVEFWIFNPIGVVDLKGHFDHALPHGFGEVEPALNEFKNVLEPDKTARCGRGVIDGDTAHMHWRIGLLKGDKRRIQPLHLFIAAPLLVRLMQNRQN